MEPVPACEGSCSGAWAFLLYSVACLISLHFPGGESTGAPPHPGRQGRMSSTFPKGPEARSKAASRAARMPVRCAGR
jgi:hypothetical protein